MITQRETDTDNEKAKRKYKMPRMLITSFYSNADLLDHMSENMNDKHVSVYGGAVISDHQSLIAYNRKRYCPWKKIYSNSKTFTRSIQQILIIIYNLQFPICNIQFTISSNIETSWFTLSVCRISNIEYVLIVAFNCSYTTFWKCICRWLI